MIRQLFLVALLIGNVSLSAHAANCRAVSAAQVGAQRTAIPGAGNAKTNSSTRGNHAKYSGRTRDDQPGTRSCG